MRVIVNNSFEFLKVPRKIKIFDKIHKKMLDLYRNLYIIYI